MLVRLVVFGLDDLVDILCELQDDLVLVVRLLLLLGQVHLKLVDLRLVLRQLLAQVILLLHLLLELLLELQQFLLLSFNLSFFRLKRGLHLSGPMGQHMFGLLQVLDLELVLIQILLSLCQLVDVVLSLLLEE